MLSVCFASEEREGIPKASVVMQRLSYPTETVLSSKITRNIIVLFKVSLRKPLLRRPLVLSD